MSGYQCTQVTVKVEVHKHCRAMPSLLVKGPLIQDVRPLDERVKSQSDVSICTS